MLMRLPSHAGRCSPHFLHWSFRANCTSPHFGQRQSPTRSTPLCIGIGGALAGLSALHLLQCVREAKFLSAQWIHIQSLPAPPAPGTGLAEPHFRHSDLLPKTTSMHLGQVQSLGLPPAGAGWAAELLELGKAGFCVPHFLHSDLLANTRPLQPGQIQSPGLPPGGAGGGAAAKAGLCCQHFLHLSFLAKLYSEHDAHVQSVCVCSAGKRLGFSVPHTLQLALRPNW